MTLEELRTILSDTDLPLSLRSKISDLLDGVEDSRLAVAEASHAVGMYQRVLAKVGSVWELEPSGRATVSVHGPDGELKVLAQVHLDLDEIGVLQAVTA